MKTYLSIDIGGTKISAAMINDGVISDIVKIQSPNTSGDHRIIEQALRDLIYPYKGMVDACSVATAGIVSDGRVRAMSPSRLWGHTEFNLKGLIEGLLDKPAYIINDAQAAAYCEYVTSQNSGDMGYITVSTGVGGGLVINGKLLTGSTGLAGHIGHVSSNIIADDEPCNCGRYGCVESIASGTAIAASAAKILGETFTAKDIFKQYYSGDEIAAQIINRSALAIANVIADMKATLDLNRMVIGGSVGLADGYIDLVVKHINSMPSNFMIQVERAACAESSELLGAYYWANNHMS
ncbi:N-acetylmannosamine kinase [Photobacterium nomapromontoriensis]|uniref:N-acetylmannosamine kinase n=1 Tax=Photobacterium nomapromontoriensis TaxID=2910237 RepID=UPI003D0A45CA